MPTNPRAAYRHTVDRSDRPSHHKKRARESALDHLARVERERQECRLAQARIAAAVQSSMLPGSDSASSKLAFLRIACKAAQIAEPTAEPAPLCAWCLRA